MGAFSLGEKKMKKIYLGGPIMDLTKKQASKWREKTKKHFSFYPGFKCLDPIRRNFRDEELASRNEIVQLDKADIIDADILLVNATKPSWGTAMEVMFAYSKHKIIIAFTGKEHKDLSPWLAYHTTRTFKTLDECVKYIEKNF